MKNSEKSTRATTTTTSSSQRNNYNDNNQNTSSSSGNKKESSSSSKQHSSKKSKKSNSKKNRSPSPQPQLSKKLFILIWKRLLILRVFFFSSFSTLHVFHTLVAYYLICGVDPTPRHISRSFQIGNVSNFRHISFPLFSGSNKNLIFFQPSNRQFSFKNGIAGVKQG